MSCPGTPILQACLDEHPDLLPDEHGLAALDAAGRLAQYDRALAEAECQLWQAGPAAFDDRLARYQALVREHQSQLEAAGVEQHRFLLAITVADRPAHVRTCLASILGQFERYGYGGRDAAGRAAKLTVILAEDSREAAHRAAHRALAEEFTARGLPVLHYDLDEQAALLHALPEASRRQLARLLTDQPAARFWRKGQAANRNLAYLKFRALTVDPARTLYYLVDSDQAFEVNLAAPDGERIAMPFSTFHVVDRIFRDHDIRVLTGKLVGDPPVSPAVMAANFLADAAAFLAEIGALDPHGACSFHGRAAPHAGEAAYHDHATSFGLGASAARYDYRCPLSGPHDHAACLASFAQGLDRFFFGEHPTRRTRFEYAGPLDTLTPARTIYPGNTVVNHAGLKFIIPFGHLRLRMSGPTAGRLIQAEIGARFVSANLPMLHRRTAGDDAAAEFRPGVAAGEAAIDIGDEFERQFFGDVMLFSVTAWLREHGLDDLAGHPALEATVRGVEAELLARYAATRETVRERRAEIAHWLAHARARGLAPASLARIERFLAHVDANFGDDAPVWRLIRSESHRAARRAQIVDALRHYRAERDAWDALFS
ncbi:MAG: hypothetical protein LDL19_02365 [Thiobacillus sp.]|nr:hypothetical protein [Thiobacillus sp.]